VSQSIPIGVDFTTGMFTYEVLIEMFNNAVGSIDIAAFYFTLTDGELEWLKCRVPLAPSSLCSATSLAPMLFAAFRQQR
jgi:hypothetical protein